MVFHQLVCIWLTLSWITALSGSKCRHLQKMCIRDRIGGVLRYGIPEFRLPKTVLDDIEYRHLALKGIKIRPNTTIGGAIGIDDLFRDGYKSIFIGTGVWKPNSLHIKGETRCV